VTTIAERRVGVEAGAAFAECVVCKVVALPGLVSMLDMPAVIGGGCYKERGSIVPERHRSATMAKSVFFGLILTSALFVGAGKASTMTPYPKALVSFDDFETLVSEVKAQRSERLIDLNTFLKMSQAKNTIILDSRSTFRFDRKHLKGAKHLSFTDFTQANLDALIPDKTTTILIYCNNNFDGDQVDFASKVAGPMPMASRETQILSNRKPIMLALNIPTYVNLYGYGFRNVYELHELVNINDKRITFEGSVVK
jgi:hypothetical protein